MSQPDFWDHQEKAQETISELKSIKSIVEDFDTLSLDLSDEIELLEMCDETEDQAHIVDVKKKISTYRGRVNKIELKPASGIGFGKNKPLIFKKKLSPA